MRRDTELIKKMIKYCGRVEDYLLRHGEDIEDFLENTEFQEGCAFCIIQIGEAAGLVSDSAKALSKDTPWRDIKGMRNILAHQYEKAWLLGIRQTMTEDLPVLKKVCESILWELEHRSDGCN
jgi:uncharacterized protein with HEPN domain